MSLMWPPGRSATLAKLGSKAPVKREGVAVGVGGILVCVGVGASAGTGTGVARSVGSVVGIGMGVVVQEAAGIGVGEKAEIRLGVEATAEAAFNVGEAVFLGVDLVSGFGEGLVNLDNGLAKGIVVGENVCSGPSDDIWVPPQATEVVIIPRIRPRAT